MLPRASQAQLQLAIDSTLRAALPFPTQAHTLAPALAIFLQQQAIPVAPSHAQAPVSLLQRTQRTLARLSSSWLFACQSHAPRKATCKVGRIALKPCALHAPGPLSRSSSPRLPDRSRLQLLAQHPATCNNSPREPLPMQARIRKQQATADQVCMHIQKSLCQQSRASPSYDLHTAPMQVPYQPHLLMPLPLAS